MVTVDSSGGFNSVAAQMVLGYAPIGAAKFRNEYEKFC